jgi:hypothetical protein
VLFEEWGCEYEYNGRSTIDDCLLQTTRDTTVRVRGEGVTRTQALFGGKGWDTRLMRLANPAIKSTVSLTQEVIHHLGSEAILDFRLRGEGAKRYKMAFRLLGVKVIESHWVSHPVSPFCRHHSRSVSDLRIFDDDAMFEDVCIYCIHHNFYQSKILSSTLPSTLPSTVHQP